LQVGIISGQGTDIGESRGVVRAAATVLAEEIVPAGEKIAAKARLLVDHGCDDLGELAEDLVGLVGGRGGIFHGNGAASADHANGDAREKKYGERSADLRENTRIAERCAQPGTGHLDEGPRAPHAKPPLCQRKAKSRYRSGKIDKIVPNAVEKLLTEWLGDMASSPKTEKFLR